MPVKCVQIDCKKRASFDTSGGKGRFCVAHKTAEMVDVKTKRCAHAGCDKLNPTFDTPGGKGRFCVAHKTAEMVDVKTKRCEHAGCDSQPVFGLPGGKKRFCVTHKTADMVDVKTKRCEHAGCDKLNPTFDTPGGKGRFCVAHKTAEMVDVKNKRCEHAGCDKQPAFDIPGDKGRFCVTHKTADMVDVKTKRCEHVGCDKLNPVFDTPGCKGSFCVTHKTTEMVNVKTKRCAHAGCDKLNSCFDTPGGKGRFCVAHKTAEMVDVKNKRCEHPECKTRAFYGRPGHSKSHCYPHRKPGMLRRPNAKCKAPKCRELAIWGINWTPRHCETHKTTDDTNLVERPCVSCGLLYVLDTTDKCESCNPAAFASARLAKQNALMAYLDTRGLTGDSTDVVIADGICGKERPDRVFDFGDKIVVIECDEHQHRDRVCLCEQTRMVNIGQSFGGLPTYFIRWNPDDYNPESDRKNPEVLPKRHKLAGDLLRDIRDGKCKLPTGLVSAVYLYYDGWDSLATVEWNVLMGFE